MLILLLPITTLCVAILGFYVWHRQLGRKRQFEVADAALAAFSRAEAALTYARNPASFFSEGRSRTRGGTETPAQTDLLDGLFVPVERLRRHSDAFDELERTAFAVEVHFGETVAHQVRAPLRAYNKIVMATSFRMGLAGVSGQDCDRMRQRLEAVVYSSAAVGPVVGAAWPAMDEVEAELAEAKWEVEAELRPWLSTPDFSEFLLVRNLFRHAIRCLASPLRSCPPDQRLFPQPSPDAYTDKQALQSARRMSAFSPKGDIDV